MRTFREASIQLWPENAFFNFCLPGRILKVFMVLKYYFLPPFFREFIADHLKKIELKNNEICMSYSYFGRMRFFEGA